jgi:hypothetical protein
LVRPIVYQRTWPGLGTTANQPFLSYVVTAVHVAVEDLANLSIARVDTTIDFGL